ncbi:lysoplasmalogenase family protein [Microbacterium nymphoidis]|uniref:lysoplasmalogenase family protein n=1 Tax=Microbacterium nymphoidis TaxID=2898586 RepID=UPI001E3C7EDD|nr:lysoplasmalogenase family protein [Microbacterium nymphoidis]MCD2499071.1 lysoplasmalogenase family protein [Microbacterium nymphoidis]
MESRSPDAEQTDEQRSQRAAAMRSGADVNAEATVGEEVAAEQSDIDRRAGEDSVIGTNDSEADVPFDGQADTPVSDEAGITDALTPEPTRANARILEANADANQEADAADRADNESTDADVANSTASAEAPSAGATASASITRSRGTRADGTIATPPTPAGNRRNKTPRGPRTTQPAAPAAEHRPPSQPSASTRRVPRWAFLPFIALSTVHVIALAFHNDALAAPTKLGLMPLLAFAVLVGARGLRATAPIALLLTAILFSWLGDGAGTFVPFLPTLPMMLAFFGIAHLAYIALFWRHLRVRKFPLAAALLVVWWAAMVIVIAPAAKELAVAVAAYGIVLGLTAAFATRCSPMVLVGALFFLASDTILAFMLFLPDLTPPITDAAVMFTYTLGQGLIAAGALATLRRRQNETPA